MKQVGGPYFQILSQAYFGCHTPPGLGIFLASDRKLYPHPQPSTPPTPPHFRKWRFLMDNFWFCRDGLLTPHVSMVTSSSWAPAREYLSSVHAALSNIIVWHDAVFLENIHIVKWSIEHANIVSILDSVLLDLLFSNLYTMQVQWAAEPSLCPLGANYCLLFSFCIKPTSKLDQPSPEKPFV